MSDPAAFFAILSFFVSLGAIAFTSRSVSRLAAQYADFVQTHINGLRTEFNKRGKDQARSFEALLHDLATNAKSGKQTQMELAELKQALADLKARISSAEEEMNARMPPRRVQKSPVLRAFPQ